MSFLQRNYMDHPNKPHTYEEWLALDNEQRLTVLFRWNASDREAIGFVYTAAGRLAIASEVTVLDVRVGTYHGGEYLIHAYVDDSVVHGLPAPLEQTFEGFRVIWLPVSRLTYQS